MSKPKILILDDDYYETNLREVTIKKLISDFCDIKVLNYFTNESWNRGEIAVLTLLKYIEEAAPSILIFDLDLLRNGEWMDGIRLMRKFKNQSNEIIWSKPKVVVSTHVEEARKDLNILDIPIDCRFNWVSLRDDTTTQANFVGIILKYLSN